MSRWLRIGTSASKVYDRARTPPADESRAASYQKLHNEIGEYIALKVLSSIAWDKVMSSCLWKNPEGRVVVCPSGASRPPRAGALPPGNLTDLA